jgi:hypothetical protein
VVGDTRACVLRRVIGVCASADDRRRTGGDRGASFSFGCGPPILQPRVRPTVTWSLPQRFPAGELSTQAIDWQGTFRSAAASQKRSSVRDVTEQAESGGSRVQYSSPALDSCRSAFLRVGCGGGGPLRGRLAISRAGRSIQRPRATIADRLFFHLKRGGRADRARGRPEAVK